MAENEARVEKYLHSRVKALGGFTRKWVSPGWIGVPDRIVFFPRGYIEFTEVKTESGRLTAYQNRRIAELKKLGFTVSVVYGVPGVDEYIEQLEQRVGINEHINTGSR